MSGYSRTARRCSDTRPKMISSKLMTVAKTGRRTDSSDSFMTSGLLFRLSARLLSLLAHRPPITQVLRSLDDHPLLFLQAIDDLDHARTTFAQLHRATRGLAVVDHEHESVALLRHDRVF